jgi:hypothetical protein
MEPMTEIDHTPSASSGEAARNRRLGLILFGIFAALAAFSVIFITVRSVH